MGGLEGIVGGLLGYGLTAVIAPYAAPAWYALNTGLGVAMGYNFGKTGNAHGAAAKH